MESAPLDWAVSDGALVIIPDPEYPREISKETNEMFDTHGFQQNWYNPCTKEKFKSYIDGFDPIEDTSEIMNFGSTSPSVRSSIRASIPFLNSAQLDELALQSELKLSKLVDSNVDLINFLRELIQAITGNISAVRRFANLYERMMKAFQDAYKRLLKQGHKEAAAYWLAWNFAIKPFISDLRAILCGVSATYKKLDYLRKHNHRVIYLDYHRKDLESLLSFDPNEWITADHILTVVRSPDWGLATPAAGGYKIQVRIHDVKLTYHARSKVFLDIPDYLLNGFGAIGALWSALNGLTNPVAVIWEAIPFSWLIDYFLSLRARLFQHVYDFNPFNEGMTVLGFGHSFTYQASCSCRLWKTHPTNGDAEVQMLGPVHYDLYNREKGLPYPEQVTFFRLPSNWYQASIIGAITVGFLPKRRRR